MMVWMSMRPVRLPPFLSQRLERSSGEPYRLSYN
jgi:hypothetical protein